MRYAAELFGTFVLVFAGLGAAVLGGGQAGVVGIALAFGIALMAMAYAIGPISGCHINPAVSLGMFLSKRMPLRDMFLYWASQVIGAILAAAVVLVIAHQGPGNFDPSVTGFGANGYGEHSPGHYSWLGALIAETFLTMILVLTVLGATDERVPPGFAPIPIGLTLTAIHFAGLPVTNGSFNPARSIGPAIFVGGWAMEQIWLFIVAPMLGAVLASRIYLGERPAEGSD
jgi:aquaporin Z